jgi:hypothetical protein
MKGKYGRKIYNIKGVNALRPNKRPFEDLFNKPLIEMPKPTTYESPKDEYRLARIASFPKDEAVLHESCVDWFYEYTEAMGLDTILNHTANQVGGYRGASAKRKGYHAGFPDISIFHVKRKIRIHKGLFDDVETKEETILHCGLFIELKTPTGRIDPLQLTTHETLRKQGYKVEIIRTYQDFKQTVINYFKDE